MKRAAISLLALALLGTPTFAEDGNFHKVDGDMWEVELGIYRVSSRDLQKFMHLKMAHQATLGITKGNGFSDKDYLRGILFGHVAENKVYSLGILQELWRNYYNQVLSNEEKIAAQQTFQETLENAVLDKPMPALPESAPEQNSDRSEAPLPDPVQMPGR